MRHPMRTVLAFLAFLALAACSDNLGPGSVQPPETTEEEES